MTETLSSKDVLKCFLRSNMPNVAYNPHGLQNMGFTWSMLPGLRALYPDEGAFQSACRRYAVHHNCHIFWGPFLTGAFLHTEAMIATGKLDPGLLQPLKETTLNSLSAIGDSFFTGSMDIACFLLIICLMTQGYLAAAVGFMLFWLLSALVMKALTFYIGLSRGMKAVSVLRRFNLINLGDYIKLFSSFLLLVFLAFSLQLFGPDFVRPLTPLGVLKEWILPVLVLLLFGYLAARVHYSRTALLVMLCLIVCFGGNWPVF